MSEDRTLVLPCSVGKVSDGYHTFDELYDHRCALYVALVNTLCLKDVINLEEIKNINCYKSKKHKDGSSYDGWFVCWIELGISNHISYHLPMKYWETCSAKEKERYDNFDGHTPNDVVTRLDKLSSFLGSISLN